jgi:hypothetical protein
MRGAILYIGLALIVLAAGCRGDGEGLCRDGSAPTHEGFCGDGSTPAGAAERPLFSVIQRDVFDQRCNTCHFGPNASSRLDLTDGVSYQNLVGVASVQSGQFLRVAPGDPDNSYLIIKLAENDPRRRQDRMPRDGPYMPAEEIQYIADWIYWGAVDDRGP